MSVTSRLLKDCRERCGLSQSEIAFKAKVNRNMISRYENGLAEPTSLTLFRLLKAMGYQVIVRPVNKPKDEERYY